MKNGSSRKHPHHITMTDEIWERAIALARERGFTVSMLIEQLLRASMKEPQPPRRASSVSSR